MDLSLFVENILKTNLDVESSTYSLSKTIDWLYTVGALNRNKICKKCGNRMTIYKDESKIDGCRFCCSCGAKLSIRDGTLFKKHNHIPLFLLTRIIFIYYETRLNAHESYIRINKKLNKKYEISYPTVKKIYAEIREKIEQYYYDIISAFKLGGIDTEIEIDEAMFAHIPLKQSTEKKKRTPLWGVGMIERITGEVRIFVSETRSKEILSKLILENVEKETTIITDAWGGYNDLGNIGYHHIAVNKGKDGFGSGMNSTSQIEGVWGTFKRYASIYSKGIPPEKAQSFLCEFWMRYDCEIKGRDFNEELAKII